MFAFPCGSTTKYVIRDADRYGKFDQLDSLFDDIDRILSVSNSDQFIANLDKFERLRMRSLHCAVYFRVNGCVKPNKVP